MIVHSLIHLTIAIIPQIRPKAKERDREMSGAVAKSGEGWRDVYAKESTIRFVRQYRHDDQRETRDDFTVIGGVAIEPFSKNNRKQLRELAKRLIKLGVDSKRKMILADLHLPEKVAPYQSKSIGTLEELANRIYLEGWTAPEVAALAPVILKAAEEGDEQAALIVNEAGMELALAARVVIEALGMANDAFEVVLSGGIFKGSPRMVEIIQQELRGANPRAEVILPRREPVIGAGLIALEAVRLTGKG